MQVLVSYTLNLKRYITKDEVERILNEEPPMQVSQELQDLLEVSTERWDIVE